MSLPSACPGLHSAKLWSKLLRACGNSSLIRVNSRRNAGDAWAAAPLSSALHCQRPGLRALRLAGIVPSCRVFRNLRASGDICPLGDTAKTLFDGRKFLHPAIYASHRLRLALRAAALGVRSCPSSAPRIIRRELNGPERQRSRSLRNGSTRTFTPCIIRLPESRIQRLGGTSVVTADSYSSQGSRSNPRF
jgi:hypothetical protein